MKVAIVSEFYPRAHDPVLGIWAHRQALAARDAGAEVRVLVLHRPVPPRATRGSELLATARRLAVHPRHTELDGLHVEYVQFIAPARSRSYGSWGMWAAPTVAVALRRLRRRFPFDLVHAHNAVPAGEASARARLGVPLVVSVHGGDVLYTAPRYPAGEIAVRRTFKAARLVLANSSGIERACQDLGAPRTRVLHLGTDLPASMGPHPHGEVLVTVGHLVGRKRHADVLRALWVLRDRRPALRYLVIGDGPEREPLARLARDLGIEDRVELAGQLPHEVALARLREASVFAMPSTDEAFGVAYVEAMAAGLPAIGSRGEPGPQEIAAAGEGMRLVPPGDVEALAAEIEAILGEPRYLNDLAAQARETVARSFTWQRCGVETVRAYEDALRGAV